MTSTHLHSLGQEPFVSLTTFRTSGDPVPTPVWIGRDGAELVVITPADTGKLKRLRRNPRVELRPCGRRGRVRDGAALHRGTAEIVEDEALVERVRGIIRAKYGAEYRIFMAIEAVVRRTRHTERVGLRIALDD